VTPVYRYKCPACGKPLESGGDGFVCPACKAVYPVTDGVPVFCPTGKYNELEQEEMARLLKAAREDGWHDAVYRSFAEEKNFLYKIITEESRADWLYLLSGVSGMSVLDVGCGWGALTVPLGRNALAVNGMDSTFGRIEFARIRARQEGLENVTFTCGDILGHPFEDGQFDLVVMNGILEWVGMYGSGGTPEELQARALRNAWGLLRDGGILYLAIENSIGFKYLMGAPDDHTQIPDITYVPKAEADALMRKRYGMDYLVRTCSRAEYNAMLEDAGFKKAEFYYPVPDYKMPVYWVPIEGDSPFAYYIQKLKARVYMNEMDRRVDALERSALETGAWRDFCSSFGIIATKG
jgi:2-polyprenyl-3-methyl-5-hydroxy-6-metoxy-1,4-benzoquinol methylase